MNEITNDDLILILRSLKIAIKANPTDEMIDFYTYIRGKINKIIADKPDSEVKNKKDEG